MKEHYQIIFCYKMNNDTTVSMTLIVVVDIEKKIIFRTS